MEYDKIFWQDHIVENPGVFKEIDNKDGTITHIPVEGDILQLGTPVNAVNLNHMDEGIYWANKLAGENSELIKYLSVEVSILKNAALNNFTNNIFIENLDDLTDITVLHGVYDSTGKRMVI